MARFFVSPEQFSSEDNAFNICGGDVRHIRDVLRLSRGDAVFICDGGGFEYKCKISSITNDNITAIVESAAERDVEPQIPVVLYQGIPKGDKMDLIIQKNVELGISRIVPVIMERTVVRFNDEKGAEKKLMRWKRIAEEAAKQCGRAVVPAIAAPGKASEILTSAADKNMLKLMLYENEMNTSLKDVLRNTCDLKNGIILFIGPEGGISSAEAALALENGFTAVTLGKRILRAETAGFAALASIRYEFGD